MGHGKLRHDNTCLNCGAVVRLRYCSACGQENIEPKESFSTLVGHFLSDITHFDGKFFSTSKNLLIKPGFLPKEYSQGKRARYLNPIRMYLFTSAAFFLIFFSFFSLKKGIEVHDINTVDSAVRNSNANTVILGFDEYKSVREYDSVQKTLPESRRDNWLTRSTRTKSIELSTRYKDKKDEFIKDLINKFFHTFPYLLFISLPLYALYLKLLYWRQKEFYYADHGIFLVHLYIFTFILLLVFFSLDKLSKISGLGWLEWINGLLIFYGVVYTFLAMRRFYGQGTGKTLFKFILLNILAFASLVLLFAVFFLLTVFQI